MTTTDLGHRFWWPERSSVEPEYYTREARDFDKWLDRYEATQERQHRQAVTEARELAMTPAQRRADDLAEVQEEARLAHRFFELPADFERSASHVLRRSIAATYDSAPDAHIWTTRLDRIRSAIAISPLGLDPDLETLTAWIDDHAHEYSKLRGRVLVLADELGAARRGDLDTETRSAAIADEIDQIASAAAARAGRLTGRAFPRKKSDTRLAWALETLARLSDRRFWARYAKKAIAHARIETARAAQMLGQGLIDLECRIPRQPHLPTLMVEREHTAIAAGREWMADQVIVADDGTERALLEIADYAAVSRLHELSIRSKGLALRAEWRGWRPFFVTLKAPSRMHANTTVTAGRRQWSEPNTRWNGTTAAETARWHQENFAKFRAAMDDANIEFFYVIDFEAHSDATPHRHMVLWIDPQYANQAKALLEDYWLWEKDRNFRTRAEDLEPGALAQRVDFQAGRDANAALAYVHKMIAYLLKHQTGSDGEQQDAVNTSPTAEQIFTRKLGARSFAMSEHNILTWRVLRTVADPDALPSELRRAWHHSHGLDPDNQSEVVPVGPTLTHWTGEQRRDWNKERGAAHRADLTGKPHPCEPIHMARYMEDAAAQAFRAGFHQDDFFDVEMRTPNDFTIDTETGEVLDEHTAYLAWHDAWTDDRDLSENHPAVKMHCRKLNTTGLPKATNGAKPTVLWRVDEATGRAATFAPTWRRWTRDEERSAANRDTRRAAKERDRALAAAAREAERREEKAGRGRLRTESNPDTDLQILEEGQGAPFGAASGSTHDSSAPRKRPDHPGHWYGRAAEEIPIVA